MRIEEKTPHSMKFPQIQHGLIIGLPKISSTTTKLFEKIIPFLSLGRIPLHLRTFKNISFVFNMKHAFGHRLSFGDIQTIILGNCFNHCRMGQEVNLFQSLSNGSGSPSVPS